MQRPKGILLLIGGSEDKGGRREPLIADVNKDFERTEILSTFIDLIDRDEPRVEVITAATTIPEDVGDEYVDALDRLGCRGARAMHIRDRREADKEDYLKRIREADAVLFPGGSQFRLATALGATRLMEIIKERYESERFIVAGTSAGAMAASAVMLQEGSREEAMLKGNITMSAGLGLINDCIIDTHFIRRGRFGRLCQAIVQSPSCIGFGLGEDTALIVYDGNEMECIGSGMVVVVDGSRIECTNILDAEDATPIYAENFIVHLLVRGNGYNLEERRFIEKISSKVEK